MTTRIKASDAIKRPPVKLPPIRRPGQRPSEPIRVSTLIKRRHQEMLVAFQRAIEQREQAFAKLARLHTKIWKLGRQLQRYEKLAQ